VLRIEGLSVHYGGLRALEGVALHVGDGEFVTIVGPNGAGKSTLLKAISGTVRPQAGRVEYHGKDLLALPAHGRAALGIAHVPEGRKVFPSLTVQENLEMGGYRPSARARRAETLDAVYHLFPVLRERRNQLAGTLSGGEQQMLAIGRGLMAQPALLLLDEPSLGLAPRVVDAIFESITTIRARQRLPILLVEQRVVEALELCDRGYVLEAGRLALSGDRHALLADARVQRAYLGS
jgi:branched-chain amino acid transport system ATP-binding protein